jgi:hypothetical protein
VLSREAAEFGESPVEVVRDALAEQSPEYLVSGGGEIADSVGMGLDARSHDCEEFRFGCRPAVGAEEPAEPTGPGGEVGKPLGGDNVPGVQRTQLKTAKARSQAGVAGPAKSQSKNPVSVPWCQAAL